MLFGGTAKAQITLTPAQQKIDTSSHLGRLLIIGDTAHYGSNILSWYCIDSLDNGIDTFRPKNIVGFFRDGSLRYFSADLLIHNKRTGEWQIIGVWENDLKGFLGLYSFDDEYGERRTFSLDIMACNTKGQKKKNWSSKKKNKCCCD